MNERAEDLKKLLERTINMVQDADAGEEKKELVAKALKVVGDAVNSDGQLDMLKVQRGVVPIVRRLEELGADVSKVTDILFRLSMQEATRLMNKASA